MSQFQVILPMSSSILKCEILLAAIWIVWMSWWVFITSTYRGEAAAAGWWWQYLEARRIMWILYIPINIYYIVYLQYLLKKPWHNFCSNINLIQSFLELTGSLNSSWKQKLLSKGRKKLLSCFFSLNLLMFSVNSVESEKNEKQWVQSYLSQYISVTIVWRGKWLEMNLKVYWLKILHWEF